MDLPEESLTPMTAGPGAGLGPTGPHAVLPDAPRELLDHPDYEIQRELGRGGMGVVYLARHRLIGRLEVLKVMQGRLAGDPGLLQRFVQEVQAVGRLRHPNIVVAYGAFRAGNALVLAMEHVPGVSLREAVRRGKPIPARRACRIARQVALGLQAAHEGGTVHRDIKPDNVMLTPADEAKVLDFGLAQLSAEGAGAGITGTGTWMGTPDYMAPEQALDAKSADIRADIYSLGCTLFFLLTGRPPFTGRSPLEVIDAHRTQAPPPLRGVPPGLAALVTRMLAKEPRGRPATPGEVAHALTVIIEAEEAGAALPAADEETLVAPPPPASGMRTALAVALVRALGLGGALAVWMAGFWPRGGPASGGPVTPPADAGGKPITNSIGMRFVPIPAGTFWRGATLDAPIGPKDGPRKIRVSAFHLGEFEVKQAEYERVLGKERNESRFKGPDLPADKVSHDDAVEFCRKLSALPDEMAAGRVYRLPTEAEWEHACRAGTTTDYNVGDTLTKDDAHYDAAGQGPKPVGSYKANAWGLHDMHGNVGEWVADWMAGYPPEGDDTDPKGPATGTHRVVRGGGWTYSPVRPLRSASRAPIRPDARQDAIGFRVVLVPAR